MLHSTYHVKYYFIVTILAVLLTSKLMWMPLHVNELTGHFTVVFITFITLGSGPPS